jgi:DNA (cytosine-5)-methyltransferase 1
MENLPACEILTAGFPCQDLSPAGTLAGIKGTKSGLVKHVFRLLDAGERLPDWVLFENVPFMLNLRRGAAIAWLIDQIEARGMRWAYRIVDSRAFGLAQRRRRLYVLASRTKDPCQALFADSVDPRVVQFDGTQPCGFYWTEGNTGLGWAVDAVPPLKGSSGVGIVSPPGIWLPKTNKFVTPTIHATEQLQGFPIDWTLPAEQTMRGERQRWKLIGNAVSTPVAAWLARSMMTPSATMILSGTKISNDRWPIAAWGERGKRYVVDVSEWPVAASSIGLSATIANCSAPLSNRAATGFYTRLMKSNLRVPLAFKRDLGKYVAQSTEDRSPKKNAAIRKYSGKR